MNADLQTETQSRGCVQRLVRRLGVALIWRIGKWKLCLTESECGIFTFRHHKSRGPKRNRSGSGDKSLTGSSLGAWVQWDRIL